MKFVLGALLEFLLILGVGTWQARRRHPAGAEEAFFEMYVYGLAAAAMVASFVIWYFTRGRLGVEQRPLMRVLAFVLVPVTAFLLVDWFRPVPDLVRAVYQAGTNTTAISFLILLIIGTVLHYLCLSPLSSRGRSEE